MTAVFHEEWFGPGACENLADLVDEVAEVEGLIVELGSWEGRSTVALANAAFPRVVHAVDTWRGSPGEPSEQLAAERDVFAQFCTNIRELTDGNVIKHVGDWRDFPIEAPVALVFIDAEHTYQAVADAIAAFRPHMAPGGIICGDDIHHPPVYTAVAASFPPGTHIVRYGPIWTVRP